MAIGSVNLPAQFLVQQEASINLYGEFVVKQWAEGLYCKFIVKQWIEDLPVRLRTMQIYDLTGTIGIGFHWQGAANPPSSIVDFIVESPTGFWVATFPDGPAEFRDVFIPWTQFMETGIVGSRPDKKRVDGFIWVVHTHGVRRIDYIYARPFGNIYCKFIVRQRVIPPAFAYIDLVGDIWLQEFGGYQDRGPGEIAFFVDDPEGWGGGYWDRE